MTPQELIHSLNNLDIHGGIEYNGSRTIRMGFSYSEKKAADRDEGFQWESHILFTITVVYNRQSSDWTWNFDDDAPKVPLRLREKMVHLLGEPKHTNVTTYD